MDAPDNLYVREDAMVRGLAVRVTLDDRDAAGATSPQGALEFLRSNAVVVEVEVYSPTRWAVITRSDGHCLGYHSASQILGRGGASGFP